MASHTPPGSKSYETDARARLCPALLCVLSQARQTAMHEDSQHKSSLSLTHVTPSSRPIPLNSLDTSPHITKHAAAIRCALCTRTPVITIESRVHHSVIHVRCAWCVAWPKHDAQSTIMCTPPERSRLTLSSREAVPRRRRCCALVAALAACARRHLHAGPRP